MKAQSFSRVVLGFVALLAALGCQTNPPALTSTQRQAIIAAANQAVHKHMTSGPIEQRGTEIPKALWGEAIEQLRPLRVVDDRVNVFIVMREDERSEEGFYVSVPISSYAPGHDERFLMFKALTEPGDKTFGEIYECKLKKPQQAESTVPVKAASSAPSTAR